MSSVGHKPKTLQDSQKICCRKTHSFEPSTSTPAWQPSETGYWATQTQYNHAHILGLLPRADMQTEILLLFLCLLR